MKIDNHLLGLSMEFEKNNIIINEWEAEKAKQRHDQRGGKSKDRKRKKKKYAEAAEGGKFKSSQDEDRAGEADNEESGFEDEVTAEVEDDVEGRHRDGSQERHHEEEDSESDGESKGIWDLAVFSSNALNKGWKGKYPWENIGNSMKRA